MKMTTIDPSKKDENSKHLLLGKEQTKHSVTLPPKKIFASKLAAAAAAAAAAAKKSTSTTTPATNGAKSMKSSTSNDTVSIKRKLSSSFDNAHTEKKLSKDKPATKPVAAKPAKSITHAERIVRACLSQYRPCKQNKKRNSLLNRLLTCFFFITQISSRMTRHKVKKALVLFLNIQAQ
jgi:uncharacterized phage infection (PIP) family protein YhgE